jgi:hypothetical protein
MLSSCMITIQEKKSRRESTLFREKSILYIYIYKRTSSEYEARDHYIIDHLCRV